MVLNIVAVSVIAWYEQTLTALIALAVFLPILSDMGGCAGNQAVAVTLRELALGVLRVTEIGRVLAKEAALGLLNGVLLGILLAVVAWLWKGNPWLGLVVGGALALQSVLATCLGGALPLLLKRLRIDPALAAGAILTSITDLCGFFLALYFANAMMPWLK
jgi:magnesium transporter